MGVACNEKGCFSNKLGLKNTCMCLNEKALYTSGPLKGQCKFKKRYQDHPVDWEPEKKEENDS